jgi:hypothetical protein
MLRDNAKETVDCARKRPQVGEEKIRTVPWHGRCFITLIASNPHTEGCKMQASTALDRDELNRLNDDVCPQGTDIDLWLDLGGSD